MRPVLWIGPVLAAAALALWWLAPPRGEEQPDLATPPAHAPPADPAPEAARERVSAPAPGREPLAPDGADPAATRIALRGRVEDPRAAPLPGARVHVGDGEEVESDDEGRFEFLHLAQSADLEARKPGWIQVHWPRPERGADGTWKPVRVVLAPRASLRVTVLDAFGQPVAGAGLRVVLSAAEPFGIGRERGLPFGSRIASSNGVTDGSGVALIADVPAQQRLRVDAHGALSVLGADGRAASFEGFDARGERLVEAEAAVLPLVLEPGEVRDVRIEVAARIRVRGTVRGSSGAPSPRALVAIRELDPDPARWPGIQLATGCDERGEFSLDALLTRNPGRLLVAATSVELVGGWPTRRLATCRDPQEIASLVLEPAADGRIEADLALELARAPAIVGRVLDPAGEPVGEARVTLHPLAGAVLGGSLASNRVRYAISDPEDGSFCLPVVPAGSYDIEVSCFDRSSVWLRGIEAGASELALEVPAGAAARVEIEVTSDHELEEVIVMFTRLHPWSPDFVAPSLPALARYSEPRGWPAPALALWYGAQGDSDVLGETNFVSWPLRSATYARELAEGAYWIGAKARGAGFHTYPIGTGLVHVGPGEHRLSFHLEPAGRISGRVLDGLLDPALRIALATDAGLLVPLDVRRGKTRTSAQIGAQGAFDLGLVPARPLELRIGTERELEAGTYRHRLPVAVERGGWLEVLVRP